VADHFRVTSGATPALRRSRAATVARLLATVPVGCVAFCLLLYRFLLGVFGLIGAVSATFCLAGIGVAICGRARPGAIRNWTDVTAGLLTGIVIAASAYALVLYTVTGLDTNIS
jgi:hypothetical protein